MLFQKLDDSQINKKSYSMYELGTVSGIGEKASSFDNYIY